MNAGASSAARLQVTAGPGGTASKLQVSGSTNFVSPGGSAPFVIEILNGGGLTAGTPAMLTLITSTGGYQLNGGTITSPLPTGLYTHTSPDFAAFNNTSLTIDGSNNLVLSFTPVPEPMTILTVAVVGLACGRLR